MGKIFSLVMICFLFEGCASLSINASGLTRTTIGADRLVVNKSGSGDVNIAEAECASKKLDRGGLTQLLGSPASSYETDSFQVLRYDVSGYRWVGVVPEILLFPVGMPLPILLPVGSNHVNFNFDKNTSELVNAEIFSHEVKFSTGFYFGHVNEGGVGPFYGTWFGTIPSEVNGWVGWDGYRIGKTSNCSKVQ